MLDLIQCIIMPSMAIHAPPQNENYRKSGRFENRELSGGKLETRKSRSQAWPCLTRMLDEKGSGNGIGNQVSSDIRKSPSKSKAILFDRWVIPGKIRRFRRPRFITQPDFLVPLSLHPDCVKDLLNGRHEDEKRRRQVGPHHGHNHPGGEVGQIHGLDCGHQRGPQHEQDQGEGDTPTIGDRLGRREHGMHLFSCRPLGQVGEIELFRIPKMEPNNHICATGSFTGCPVGRLR